MAPGSAVYRPEPAILRQRCCHQTRVVPLKKLSTFFFAKVPRVKDALLKVWSFGARRPRAYLLFALVLAAFAAVLIGHGHPLDVAFLQFDLGAQQILATHHVQSTFLPIGYSAFYGYLELLGRHFGPSGAATTVFVAQIGVLLSILLLARAILQHFTTARFATTAALLVTLEPALLYNTKRITDANVTLALLLAFVACLLQMQQDGRLRSAGLCGFTLALAVLVRPNLLLLSLLLLGMVRQAPWGKVAGFLVTAVGVAAMIYAGVTTAVHGRPFLPQNGPYNLYAGFNPETKGALLTRVNGEVSIVPAMNDLGLHPTLDWHRQSDVPGVDDVRDERYIPFYNREAQLFLRQHPGQSVELVAVKFLTFMRPIHENVDNSSGAFHILRSTIKTITLTFIVIWLGALFYNGVRRLGLASPLMIWTAILYTLPFALINADPRFRTALEGLVCVDLARMLYLRRRQTQGRAL